jgi:uncharacterized membrane protein
MINKIKKHKFIILESIFGSLLICLIMLIGSIALTFFSVILIYLIEEGENLRKKKEYIQ